MLLNSAFLEPLVDQITHFAKTAGSLVLPPAVIFVENEKLVPNVALPLAFVIGVPQAAVFLPTALLVPLPILALVESFLVVLLALITSSAFGVIRNNFVLNKMILLLPAFLLTRAAVPSLAVAPLASITRTAPGLPPPAPVLIDPLP